MRVHVKNLGSVVARLEELREVARERLSEALRAEVREAHERRRSLYLASTACRYHCGKAGHEGRREGE